MEKSKIEESIKKCYSTWGKTYYDEYYGPNAPYPPVHRDHLKSLIRTYSPKTLLDAGCGPASFLRDVFDQPCDFYGFDLTPEMVQEGKRVFSESGRNPAHLWQGSVLDKADFRNPEGTSPTTYDGAICIGVFPHISESADIAAMHNLRDCLKPGGFAVIEARNQLFSLFTMNRYSYEFIRDELIRPNQLGGRLTAEQAQEMASCVEEMKSQFRMDLPPIRAGKAGEPGYDQVLSRTHNPMLLRQQFSEVGFRNVRTLFHHFHALPPMFSRKTSSFFLRESIAMEDAPEDWRGNFMASAFLLVGERA